MEYTPQPGNQESKYKELADQLAQFNSKINDGRGSSTLRLIIDALERNNFGDAKAITATDFDKLRQYDDDNESLQKLLEKVGLKDKLKHF